MEEPVKKVLWVQFSTQEQAQERADKINNAVEIPIFNVGKAKWKNPELPAVEVLEKSGYWYVPFVEYFQEEGDIVIDKTAREL